MLLEVLGTGFSGSYKTKRVYYFFAMRSADQLFSCSVTKSNDSWCGLERIVVECTIVDANTNDTHVTIHVRCFGLDHIATKSREIQSWYLYAAMVDVRVRSVSVRLCACMCNVHMCTVHGRGMTPYGLAPCRLYSLMMSTGHTPGLGHTPSRTWCCVLYSTPLSSSTPHTLWKKNASSCAFSHAHITAIHVTSSSSSS